MIASGCAAATLIVGMTLGRYTLVSSADHDSIIVYRLDRWTGNVAAVSVQGIKKLAPVEPK